MNRGILCSPNRYVSNQSSSSLFEASAGSVIGAYMVSRQMCLDVYLDILPAAQRTFVCIQRFVKSISVTAIDWILSHVPRDLPKLASRQAPGMNISFVVDGIMDADHGVRPLDLQSFRENDLKQPLRVASSYVKDGKLLTKSFGTADFFPDNQKRVQDGLFTCLKASMTVPGAAGPPVQVRSGNETLPFFDAFCFEPLPYRSAVDEGATHCLVLCSRPEGFQPKTKPGVYEKGVAPLYFRSHGEPQVANFFDRGGQQFVYAEDLFTLEEGKCAGVRPLANTAEAVGAGVIVPPPRILYGVDEDLQGSNETTTQTSQDYLQQRDEWKRAHLLPLKVPDGTPELATIEQGKKEVLQAVREGFAAAFDLLAPGIGLDLDSGELTGSDVAKMVFPGDNDSDDDDDETDYSSSILENQLRVVGDIIGGDERRRRRRKRAALKRAVRFILRQRKKNHVHEDESQRLLKVLPGFRAGRMSHLAGALR